MIYIKSYPIGLIWIIILPDILIFFFASLSIQLHGFKRAPHCMDFILKRKKNIILYGPPGTGKTWNAKKIAKSITHDKNNGQTWYSIASQVLIEN